jgi:hypothetical protein
MCSQNISLEVTRIVPDEMSSVFAWNLRLPLIRVARLTHIVIGHPTQMIADLSTEIAMFLLSMIGIVKGHKATTTSEVAVAFRERLRSGLCYKPNEIRHQNLCLAWEKKKELA